MGDPMIYVGEKAAFPGWWDNVVIELSTPLVMWACLCLFTFILQSFLYYLFSSSVPYLNLLFPFICTNEREKWLVMGNIYAPRCVSHFYIAH